MGLRNIRDGEVRKTILGLKLAIPPDWGQFGVRNFLVDIFGRKNFKRDFLGSYAETNGLNF